MLKKKKKLVNFRVHNFQFWLFESMMIWGEEGIWLWTKIYSRNTNIGWNHFTIWLNVSSCICSHFLFKLIWTIYLIYWCFSHGPPVRDLIEPYPRIHLLYNAKKNIETINIRKMLFCTDVIFTDGYYYSVSTRFSFFYSQKGRLN